MNVKDFVEMVVKYGDEDLGVGMATMTSDVVRMALGRKYKAQLSLAAGRGYANFILDMTK